MASRKTSAKRKAEEARAKRQIHAIILFAVGLFLGALAFIEGDNLWLGLHQTLFGLLGPGAYFIAPLLIYVAVMTTLDKPVGTIGGKVWQTSVLILLISAAVQIFAYGMPTKNRLWDAIKELFVAGNDLNGGGVLSSAIALPMLSLCGDTGAKVLIVLLIFVFAMIFSGATLIGLYRSAMKPVRHISSSYSELMQRRQEEEQSESSQVRSAQAPRFNVDVPLDREPPAPRRKKKEPIEPEVIFQTPSAAPEPTPVPDPIPVFAPDPPFESEPDVPADPFDSVPQGSFARQAIESPIDSARDSLFSAAHPAGKFNFDLSVHDASRGILQGLYNGPVSSDGLPLEMPEDAEMSDFLNSASDDTQTPDEASPVLRFRTTPEHASNRPQTTDEVIDEILRRALTSDEESPSAEEIMEAPAEEAAEEAAFDDGVIREIPDSAESAFEEEIPPEEDVPFPEEIPPVKEQAPSLPAAAVSPAVSEAPPEPAYAYPPIALLNEPARRAEDGSAEELKANAQRLVDTLQSFGVQTRVIDIARGPAVTRYELQPSAGVKISKITSLADDIALNLAAAGVRIEAPIPNKPAVGIEVPNKRVSTVQIREIIDSDEFRNSKSPLTISLGRDISGRVTVADASKMPHMLIAGSTGSGKSVCINSIIISLLYKSSPDQVKLLMVDPKVVELGIYNGIPHLLVPVVTDPKKAAGALAWAVNEMLQRYKLFADNQVRDISGFNRLCQSHPELTPMPQIVIIIDELADLMMAAPGDVEDSICRLAQMARAAGMHLIIATQRPSVDVITGVIKANIPSRIAFAVSSAVDSRTILDSGGAEKLLGRGDMLFYPVGAPKPQRIQGCFVSDQEVEAVVDFIKRGGESEYDDSIMEEIERQAAIEKGRKKSTEADDGGGFQDEDEMLPAAIECVVEMGMASTSMLQRKLKLGYARAARIVDQLEAKGIVGPFEGSKPRQVLITRDQLYEMKLHQEP